MGERVWKRRNNETDFEYKERLFRNVKDYELDWNEVNELLNKKQHGDSTRKSSYGYLEAIEDLKNTRHDKKILVLNDIHVPFHRSDLFEIIKKHADEITHLVIGGDFLDCETISVFPKMERGTFIDEIISGYEVMKEIRKILDKDQKIIAINGNHEERLYKTICNMKEKGLQMLLNPHVLSMYQDGFTLYPDHKKIKYNPIENFVHIPHWFVNIDEKLIISHPKDFSRVKGKMLENVASHFINRHEKFDAIVMAHTHKFATGIVDRFAGSFVVENSCMCKPHDYADIGKLGYSPQAYGYCLIKYNDDENIDFNNIKIYHLQAEVKLEDSNYKVEL